MCPSMTFDINSFSQCETARMGVVITKETFSNNGKLTPFWMTNQLSVDFNNRLLFLNLLYIFFLLINSNATAHSKNGPAAVGR